MRLPVECGWEFPPTDRWPDDDLVLVGADLDPDTVLCAYTHGLFPMFADRKHRVLGWWSPVRRGVVPLDGLRVTRSLRRSMHRYTCTVDVAFETVMSRCGSTRTNGNWITPAFESSYGELHRRGHAHSVEVWDADGSLVGGLYGIRINGFFAGESMFHVARDASKVALVHLVGLMRLDGMTLLDTQWCTEHLAGLGCIEVPRGEDLEMLARALAE